MASLFSRGRLQEIGRMLQLAEERCPNLEDVPIEECNEPLVVVPPALCYPYYFKHMGLSSSKMYLRRTVCAALLRANALAAHHGYEIRLYDGYRSNGDQQKLFSYYLATYVAPRHGYVGWMTEDKTVQRLLSEMSRHERQMLIRETTVYVAIPSEDPKRPANHRTGGSADVWLYQDGKPCDMGTVFDHMDKEASLFYHLLTKRKAWPTGALNRTVKEHRELLLYCMVEAGFHGYLPECWHYDLGNQRWARVKNTTARYGAADHLLPSQ